MRSSRSRASNASGHSCGPTLSRVLPPTVSEIPPCAAGDSPVPSPHRRSNMRRSRQSVPRLSLSPSPRRSAIHAPRAVARLFHQFASYNKDQILDADRLESELNQMANDNAKLMRDPNKKYILSMHSPFKMYWDSVLAFATCYALIYIPANIAFGLSDTNRTMFDIQVIVDTLLVLDVLVRFQTSYEDPFTHQEVFDAARIRQRYIVRWFALDFLGSVPSSFLGRGAYIRYPSLKFIRLCIILRAVHMAQSTVFVTFMHRMSRRMNSSLLRLFLLGILYLVALHYVACGYYVMTAWEKNDSKWAIPFVANDTTAVKYIGSFYQALAATSGASLNPKTMVEMHATSTLLLLGIVVNASIFGTCATLMKQVNLVADEHARQVDAIRTGLIAHHATEDLQARIMHYYDSVLGEEKAHVATATGLEGLPPKLNVQLTLMLHVDFLRKVPLFYTMELDDIVALVQGLERVVALAGEVIVRQGEIVRFAWRRLWCRRAVG
ncbi:hypothetical protein, variant [Aphanomyces invadans]|uniref:Cyclic nucleotide-binding domain-containing protein n=1 Tax=Aphanomyces invadans TaxID=157072 RepID=A0A024TJB9_9STRA|nr:hypothetical protein, variant [Aphanomyces invadans]ETV94089.1 hypothetical protein, variant [Aphanomyces invadans]|eukprot:XP_008877291.1 hypothetical protein, variant [Aphanomyces invadans]